MRDPIVFESGENKVIIHQAGDAVMLESNLKDGDATADGDIESREFDLVVDGIEHTLLALYPTGALHAMTPAARQTFFNTVLDALTNF